jgi:membrane protein DedA with SNARE-associated domain
METLIVLVQQYGYILVFIGTLLEGETIVAIAGFAAYGGYLKLSYIIPIAIVGAMIGDQLFFYFGRYKGRKFLAKRPQLEAKIERIHALLEHYHGWIIFGSRFMYGFRALIPMALGVSRVSAVKFFLLNFLGAVVWGIFFAFGGYVFGGAIEHFLGNVKKFEGLIVAGALTLLLGAQILVYIRKKRNKQVVVKMLEEKN